MEFIVFSNADALTLKLFKCLEQFSVILRIQFGIGHGEKDRVLLGNMLGQQCDITIWLVKTPSYFAFDIKYSFNAMAWLHWSSRAEKRRVIRPLTARS